MKHKIIVCIVVITMLFIQSVLVNSAVLAATSEKEVKVLLDDKSVDFDVPPQIIDGRTLVPIRVIAECSGCIVEWDNANNAVIIKTPSEKDNSGGNEAATPEKEQPIKNEDTENNEAEPQELSCKASLRKSLMSIGGKYKIVFSVVVEGNGGDGEYMYRYEILQNNKISKESNFAKENTFEGELSGSGECTLTVFVRDKSGTIAEKEFTLTE